MVTTAVYLKSSPVNSRKDGHGREFDAHLARTVFGPISYDPTLLLAAEFAGSRINLGALFGIFAVSGLTKRATLSDSLRS